jgi:hypothetical protein
VQCLHAETILPRLMTWLQLMTGMAYRPGGRKRSIDG